MNSTAADIRTLIPLVQNNVGTSARRCEKIAAVERGLALGYPSPDTLDAVVELLGSLVICLPDRVTETQRILGLTLPHVHASLKSLLIRTVLSEQVDLVCTIGRFAKDRAVLCVEDVTTHLLSKKLSTEVLSAISSYGLLTQESLDPGHVQAVLHKKAPFPENLFALFPASSHLTPQAALAMCVTCITEQAKKESQRQTLRWIGTSHIRKRDLWKAINMPGAFGFYGFEKRHLRAILSLITTYKRG